MTFMTNNKCISPVHMADNYRKPATGLKHHIVYQKVNLLKINII